MATSRTTAPREGVARRTVGAGSGIAANVRRSSRWARTIERRRHSPCAYPCARAASYAAVMVAAHVSSSGAGAATHVRAMDENIIVTTFTEDSRAYVALARLKELAAEDRIDLHDGAVVERAPDGTLHVRDEAGNEDEGLATLTGGTIGLLIGILAGPLGVLLGGAMGLLAGAIIDADDDEETHSVLEHISRSIANGETAVLADVGESGPTPVDGAAAALGGH